MAALYLRKSKKSFFFLPPDLKALKTLANLIEPPFLKQRMDSILKRTGGRKNPRGQRLRFTVPLFCKGGLVELVTLCIPPILGTIILLYKGENWSSLKVY